VSYVHPAGVHRKRCGQVLFFSPPQCFVFRLGKDKVCSVGGAEQSAAPAANKRTLTICSLTELKHVVGLTEQPLKTLPTMSGTPGQAQLHTHTHTHTPWGGAMQWQRGWLTKLKHAIKLTKLEKLDHGIRRAKVNRVIRLSTLMAGAVDATQWLTWCDWATVKSEVLQLFSYRGRQLLHVQALI
jgi:hypothetical protein